MADIVKDPLEALAVSAENQQAIEKAEQAGQEGQGEPGQADAAPGIDPMIMSGLAMLPLWALKALRERIAKRLPEIREHWTDEALSGPANALPPLLTRYLQSLAPVLNENPELSMFVLSCLPLALGYFAASSMHAEKQAKEASQKLSLGGVADNAGEHF